MTIEIPPTGGNVSIPLPTGPVTVDALVPPKLNVATVTEVVVGPPGPKGDKGDQGIQGVPGPEGMIWLGAWSAATNYAIDAGVSYNGASYIAVAASLNKPPNSSPEWNLLAAKGDQGVPGSGLATVTTVDTATIDFSGAGLAGDPLTADVKPNSVGIIANDTATIDFTGVGTTASPLTAVVKPGSVGPQVPVYDECGDLTQWTQAGGTGTATVANVADSAAGGNVIRCVGWVAPLVRTPLVPFDPKALYRIRFRARQTVDGPNNAFYAGVAGVAADGTTIVGASGTTSLNASYLCAANAAVLTVAGGWQDFVGYLRGFGTPNGNAEGRPSPSSPGLVHQNVRYLKPVFYANQTGGTGTTEIDFVSIEVVPDTFLPSPLPLYDEGNSVADWLRHNGANAPVAAQIGDVGASGGKVLRCTGQMCLTRMSTMIPYDPNALYRVRFRVRQITDSTPTGQTQFFAGLTGVTADGGSLVNALGANDAGSGQHYVAAAGVVLTPAMGWTDFVGYVRGVAAQGSLNPCPAPATPGVMHQDTRYIRPLVNVNYNGTNGVMEIDYVSIEVVPSCAENPVGNWVVPTGDIHVGDPASTPIRLLYLNRKIGADQRQWRMYVHDSGQLSIEAFKNGAGDPAMPVNVPQPLSVQGNVVATGAVTAGDGTTSALNPVSVTRNLSGKQMLMRMVPAALAGAGAAIQIFPDWVGAPTVCWSLVLDQTGKLCVVDTAALVRPVPFAMFATTPLVTVTAAVFADVVLDLTTLCPGRFTAPPVVQATSVHTSFVCMISALSTTSVTIRVRHVDNVSSTAGPFGVHVLLTQMTPTAGPG